MKQLIRNIWAALKALWLILAALLGIFSAFEPLLRLGLVMLLFWRAHCMDTGPGWSIRNDPPECWILLGVAWLLLDTLRPKPKH